MKKCCLALLLILISGCSSQFAYNNMDWLIHWYLDDHIDLDKAQKSAFDARFSVWHDWHRKNELPRYVDHLTDIKVMLEQGELTTEDINAQFERARDHWKRFRAHIAPDIAALAIRLTDEQIEEMFASLEENNIEDEEERREASPEELQEAFQERFEDQLKNYFGRLTEQQKNLVSAAVTQVVPNRLEWITYRRAVQSAAKDLMLQRHDNPDFEADFLSLLTAPENYQHQQYLSNLEHNREVYADLVMTVYPTLTDKQKRRLTRKIDNFIEDFTELALDE